MSETWIVGINPVEGALANDAERVRELRVEQGSRNPRVTALAEEARKRRIAVHAVRRSELERLAGKHARHQGVAARYFVEALGTTLQVINPIEDRPFAEDAEVQLRIRSKDCIVLGRA